MHEHGADLSRGCARRTRAIQPQPERLRALGVDHRRRRPHRLRHVAAEEQRLDVRRPRRPAAAPRRHRALRPLRGLRHQHRRRRRRHARGASRLPRREKTGALRGCRGGNVLESATINRSIEELYRFWRNLENLPQFMRHLDSVEKVTDTISHWKAKGPGGTTVEWNAEIYNEEPSKLIAWRSIEGSDVVSAGSVNFDNAGPGRGTRGTVNLQYSPPGGKIGARIARLFGRDAATEIREDLRRFKQLVEAGEVP